MATRGTRPEVHNAPAAENAEWNNRERNRAAAEEERRAAAEPRIATQGMRAQAARREMAAIRPAYANLYPLLCPEVLEELTRGDRAILLAMRRHGSCTALSPQTALGAAHAAQGRVYRVRSGWLARTRRLGDGRRQIVSFLLPGDLIGLRSALIPRQADTVEALTAASVDSLDPAQFRELARTNPAIALRAMYQFAEDERRLDNWVTVLGQGKHAERIALMLLELRLRLHGLGLMLFSLPLTQRDIADHVGLHVVHVNRAIGQLREQGLLALANGQVVIQDLAGLERIARPMLDAFESDADGISPTAG